MLRCMQTYLIGKSSIVEQKAPTLCDCVCVGIGFILHCSSLMKIVSKLFIYFENFREMMVVFYFISHLCSH